jgi:hypothetical protein
MISAITYVWNYWAWLIEKFPIIFNKSQRLIHHSRWQLFSPTLLVEMDESLLIR